MPNAGTVLAAAARIKTELKNLGWWSAQPPPDEAFHFTRPFALDTLTFSQWLQWVLLPRVREAADAEAFPSESRCGPGGSGIRRPARGLGADQAPGGLRPPLRLAGRAGRKGTILDPGGPR